MTAPTTTNGIGLGLYTPGTATASPSSTTYPFPSWESQSGEQHPRSSNPHQALQPCRLIEQLNCHHCCPVHCKSTESSVGPDTSAARASSIPIVLSPRHSALPQDIYPYHDQLLMDQMSSNQEVFGTFTLPQYTASYPTPIYDHFTSNSLDIDQGDQVPRASQEPHPSDRRFSNPSSLSPPHAFPSLDPLPPAAHNIPTFGFPSQGGLQPSPSLEPPPSAGLQPSYAEVLSAAPGSLPLTSMGARYQDESDLAPSQSNTRQPGRRLSKPEARRPQRKMDRDNYRWARRVGACADCRQKHVTCTHWRRDPMMPNYG